MRHALAVAIFFLASTGALASQTRWEILPKGRLFPLGFADPREIRMALLFDEGGRVSALVGNYFSLVGMETDWGKMYFGLEGAGYFSMRRNRATFPLEHTDGLIGVYAEAETGPLRAQLRFTHVSAHLSDGIAGSPIVYSREFVAARLAYHPDSRLLVYAGATVNAHAIPAGSPVGAQAGGFWFAPWSLGKLTPFFAADLKLKREPGSDLSLGAQLGIALNNPPEAYRSFRLFYSFFHGTDPRGQFHLSTLTSHSFGIEMQI